MKRKTISDMERRAYHEAGHAVAQYRAGISTKLVSIRPDKECQGRTRFQVPPGIDLHDGSSRTQSYIDHCVMTVFAGAAAEKRRTGKTDEASLFSDLQTAVQIATFGLNKNMSGRGVLEYLAIMEGRAKQLIRRPENWILVEAVANALLQERFIWGKRVREIMERSDALSGVPHKRVESTRHYKCSVCHSRKQVRKTS